MMATTPFQITNTTRPFQITNTTLNAPVTRLNIQIEAVTRGYSFPPIIHPFPGAGPNSSPVSSPNNIPPVVRTINIIYDSTTKLITGDVTGHAGDNIHVVQIPAFSPLDGDRESPEFWFTVNSKVIQTPNTGPTSHGPSDVVVPP